MRRVKQKQPNGCYFILVMPPEKIAIFIRSSLFSFLVFLAFIPLSIQYRGFILLFTVAGI